MTPLANTLSQRPYRWRAPVSAIGLVVAVVFLGLSITPSMVPRSPELQGVLGGLVAGIGYLSGGRAPG